MQPRDTPPEEVPSSDTIYHHRTLQGIINPYQSWRSNNNNNNNNHGFSMLDLIRGSSTTTTTLFSSLFPPVSSIASGIPPDGSLAAATASKNHREAEKRRRERINSHLQRLRSLLPCNSKTDKASLLAKVVEHVRDLKQKTSEEIAGTTTNVFPSEHDEISVSHIGRHPRHQSVYKAIMCCEDRSNLLPELIKTLKSLRLRTLKAEMSMVGGRVKNVLIVAGEEQEQEQELEENSIGSLREALKSLIGRDGSGDRCKRRRVSSDYNSI
ncbi:Transcription factor bHLH30 [Acorus calamus]|uniref:Transcription factor bHLH30 n=1 Tax=Acorus calamus TaxID=4465 RepID=A0AAV9CW27_ACOCL|nr:Transcription factor bHLH30 [Acorus calamus]